MALLLDTHIWIWSILEPERLAGQVHDAITGTGERPRLSPISVWETLLLAQRGRIQTGPDPMQWIRQALVGSAVVEAPLTFDVAARSRSIRLPHEDPADRFLAATASVYDLELVTADARLLACPDIRTLACA